MASYWFPEGLEEISKATAAWLTGTIKARLVGALPDSTITSMTGVTGIGDDQTLSSCALVRDDTLACVKFVAGNPTFSTLAAGSTAIGAVVYQAGSSDSDSIPLILGHFTGIPTNGGDVTLGWPSLAGTDGVVAYLHEGGDQHVAFTWSSNSTATSYTLKIGTASSVYDVFDADVGNVTTYSVALQPGTYYAVAVPSTTAEQEVVVP